MTKTKKQIKHIPKNGGCDGCAAEILQNGYTTQYIQKKQISLTDQEAEMFDNILSYAEYTINYWCSPLNYGKYLRLIGKLKKLLTEK